MTTTYANITAEQIELLRAFKPQHVIYEEKVAEAYAKASTITSIELVEFNGKKATFLVNGEKTVNFLVTNKFICVFNQLQESFYDDDTDCQDEFGNFVSEHSKEDIEAFGIEAFNDVEMETFEEAFPEDFKELIDEFCGVFEIDGPDESVYDKNATRLEYSADGLTRFYVNLHYETLRDIEKIFEISFNHEKKGITFLSVIYCHTMWSDDKKFKIISFSPEFGDLGEIGNCYGSFDTVEQVIAQIIEKQNS